MQIAVFTLVIAGRRFDVLDLVFTRQRYAIDALDPGTLLLVRLGQVDPHRLHFFQIAVTLDVDLVQAAVLQYEYIDHAYLADRFFREVALQFLRRGNSHSLQFKQLLTSLHSKAIRPTPCAAKSARCVATDMPSRD